MTSFETKQAAREVARQQKIIASAELAATKAADKARKKGLAKLKIKAMTPTQYRAALKTLEISIVGAAAYFGISRRQAQRISADTPVPNPIEKLIKLLLDGKLQKEDLL